MALRRSFSASRKWSAGLDVSRGRSKLVCLSRRSSGEIVLEDLQIIEEPEHSSIDGSLRRLWKGLGKRAEGVHCNLGPVGVIVQQMEFPEMNEEDLDAATRIEAEQLIPNIDEMVLDFQVLGRQPAIDGAEAKVTVLVVAAPQEAVTERTKLLFSANLSVLSVVPDAIALANVIRVLRTPSEGPVVVVDIGERDTRLVAVSPESMGLAPFCHYIALGIGFLAGEQQEAEGGAAGSQDGRSSQRQRWLREVERSMGFVEGKVGVPADGLLIVGGGAASEQTMKWLSDDLMMAVTPWNPVLDFERGADAPDRETIEAKGCLATVALGLALLEGN